MTLDSVYDSFYLIANSYWEAQTFEFSVLKQGVRSRLIDTSLAGDQAIVECQDQQALSNAHENLLQPRSIVVLLIKAS